MKKHTIEYVKFHGEGGLQSEICKELGIDYSDFRNYHKVVGGEYKDLWHFWLWLISDRLYNDSYIPESFGERMDDEYFEYKKKEYKEYTKHQYNSESVDWIVPVLKAISTVFEKYGGKYYDLIIYYFW